LEHGLDHPAEPPERELQQQVERIDVAELGQKERPRPLDRPDADEKIRGQPRPPAGDRPTVR
jgi:hypothetical protein